MTTAISLYEASVKERPDIDSLYERCGYRRKFNDEDTILLAKNKASLVGVVRLCPENGEIVLRGLQVLPERQRQGMGRRLLDECLPRVNEVVCYCIPWSYLERFYVWVANR